MPTNDPTDVFKLINMSGGRDVCWPGRELGAADQMIAAPTSRLGTSGS